MLNYLSMLGTEDCLGPLPVSNDVVLDHTLSTCLKVLKLESNYVSEKYLC